MVYEPSPTPHDRIKVLSGLNILTKTTQNDLFKSQKECILIECYVITVLVVTCKDISLGSHCLYFFLCVFSLLCQLGAVLSFQNSLTIFV